MIVCCCQRKNCGNKGKKTESLQWVREQNEKDRELISAPVFFHLSGNYTPSTGNEKLPIATLGDDSNSVIFSPKSRR